MERAIEVAVGVRSDDPHLYFTDNVTAWSPNLVASSIDELKAAFDERNSALDNVALVVTGVDVINNKAFAEWVMQVDHVGTLMLDDLRIEASNRRLKLGGATIAEFEGHKIRAFRSYFDTVSLVEQMVDS
jgi:hypothetical protein